MLYCVQVGPSCQYTATMPTLPNESKMRTQKIDQAYLKNFERLAEERVKKAGFRLAHLLNSGPGSGVQRTSAELHAEAVSASRLTRPVA